MELLNIASFGFFVVFLGTLFLFGELLVKVKGFFGIIGIGIMAIYFSFHISVETGLWVIILYIAGLVMIVVDGKVITDGTVAILGIILMILGLAIPAPTFLYGVLVSMGFIFGGFSSFLFLKVFPHRNLWSKMTLRDRLTGDLGYNSINESYKLLIGKTGRTLTPFRPIGTIVVDGKQYSATSETQWIEANEEVVVVSVDGTKIVIQKLEKKPNEQETTD
ncbi:NfeD family protein [Bacillus sp. FJAT-45350]|uniref:NfeD family protein n=1 Tax=Bacillus sp. FJAT-45350 TaxID=2011014 RepID=UPI000BB78371|nr:NfeD family protein [Bacillus sp. FJAT-45350]